MRRFQYLIVLCTLLSTSVSYASSIKFHDGNFESAKELATKEGKMVLVDFYASWCAPCKWMDETTFQDPEVITRMNSDYVSLKINIDDFDGYALKELYGVKVLPTVLIFDHKGKVVERIEETLPPSRMNNLLEKNKSNTETRVYDPNVVPVTNTTTTLSEDDSYSMKYKLQLGVFSSYQSTLKYYKEVKGLISKPIVILHDYKGSNVIYRVLTGSFSNTTEAEIYKTQLKDSYNISSRLYY